MSRYAFSPEIRERPRNSLSRYSISARSNCSHVVESQSTPEVSRVGREGRKRVATFQDDDAGYREWIYANMGGYVVNAIRGIVPSDPVLHRATCETITPTPDKVWTGDYTKVCSSDRYELEAWARSIGRSVRACSFCDP